MASEMGAVLGFGGRVGTCAIGGGGTKALRRAGQRVSEPPAARLGGEEGERGRRSAAASPAVFRVSRGNQRGGGRAAGGRVLGWEGAVPERSRKHPLRTPGSWR